MTVTEPAVPAVPLKDLQQDIWIFGFGSLVHNPGFEHAGRVEGFIRGYKRVFWQGSTDHRGVPGAPGRVVTLEPHPQGSVWGVAYRLAGNREQQQRTLQYLEWREKQYDHRAQVEVFTRDGGDVPVITALTYIATSDRRRNPNYLGPAPLDDIAHQIAGAHGPSGPNWQYVVKLADAMRQLSVHDEELFLLEAKVRARLALLGSTAGEASEGSSQTGATAAAVQPAGGRVQVQAEATVQQGSAQVQVQAELTVQQGSGPVQLQDSEEGDQAESVQLGARPE